MTTEEWHAWIDCEEDVVISSTLCGKNSESPYCHLQHVLDNIQEGDTIYLNQKSTGKQSPCDQRKLITVGIRKSFTLKTVLPNATLNQDHTDQDPVTGIQGIHVTFTNNCSESCTLTIDQSYFICSSITVNNLNTKIQNSTFKITVS